jgi:hypothetical protein
MAEASTTTSKQTTVSSLSKRVLSGLSKLGGTRPRSNADYTCPADDCAELMVVTRDFLCGMPEVQDATCAFPLVRMDVDEEDDVQMEMGTSAAEEALIRLARHLVFACGNTRGDAFLHVVLFIVGAFGQHCRDKTCSRSDECALRELADAFDPEQPQACAEAFLKLHTPIAVWANIVRDMRAEAMECGRLSLFERVTEQHGALLASVVYPTVYPQSLKAKCFSLFRQYIAEDGKFYATTPPNISSVLKTFDGQTKTYLSAPEDCTEMLKAELASVNHRLYGLCEFVREEPIAIRGPKRARAAAAAAAAAGAEEDAPVEPPVLVDITKRQDTGDLTGGLLIKKLALSQM